MKFLKRQNKLLLLILFIAFLLRIVGLTPNFQQHPDEPGVIEPANQIMINTILNHNPDPNVEPHPFKYASAIFHMHALIRGVFLSGAFFIYETTGYTFSISESKLGHPDFEAFIKETGPYFLSDTLLWLHRLPSVIFGTATVLLVYKLALILFKNRNMALLAALALAIMPHHVRDSHYATVTITQTFFFLLSFFLSAKIWQQTTTKNFIWAGLAIGFATSIKYFPLPILPLLFFLFLARRKLKRSQLLITVISILVGYFLGMPYIFVHLQEIINAYKSNVGYYVSEQALNQSFIERLLPPFLHSYHLQFFLKDGVGPILAAIGAFGMLVGLRRWPLVICSLFIIPVVNFLFISLYLEPIYDTLMMPNLPFFAVFIGIGCWWLISHLPEPFPVKIAATTILLGIIFLPPFVQSAQASFACSQSITEWQAHDWIAENVTEGSVLAYQPNMRLPSKNFNFVRSEPKENFLLSEIQGAGTEYIALHSGYTDRYPQWLDDNIFLPQYIKDNEFTHLVLKEFDQNSQLLKSFVKPAMCVNSRIYIYKVPPVLSPAQKLATSFDFNTQNALLEWELGKPRIPSGTKVEMITTEDKSTLRYQYDPQIFSNELPKGALQPAFYGTPLRSPFIDILGGKKYSASLLIKKENKPLSQIPNGFLRLDFYMDKNKEPVLTRISPRIILENSEWQTLSVTSLAPANARFVTMSFQTLLVTEPSQFLIDKVEVLIE